MNLAEHPNFYPEDPYEPDDPEFIKYVEDNILWPKNPLLKALSSLKVAGEYLKDQLSLGISMEIRSLKSVFARFELSPEAIMYMSMASGHYMVYPAIYPDQQDLFGRIDK